MRGKALTATAWHLDLPLILEGSELKWWQIFQLPIPDHAVVELGIATWQDTRLEPAITFLTSTTALSMYAAHIGDFLNMPELDDEGINQLQVYLQKTKSQLEEAFQSTLDTSTTITNTFTQLTMEEQAQRPAPFRIGTSAHRDAIGPSSQEDYYGQVQLTVTDIAEWAERLKKAREYAGLLYFFLGV